MACCSVHSLSFASAILRDVRPMATTITAMPAAVMPAMVSPRRDRTLGVESDGMGFSGLCSRVVSLIVKDAEDDGNEKQCRDGSADEAADHGAAERRVLFAAFAKPE